MPFRHDGAETEKKDDHDKNKGDEERRSHVFLKLSTSVFKLANHDEEPK